MRHFIARTNRSFRSQIRIWGYVLALVCALSLPGAAHLVASPGVTVTRAGSLPQIDPQVVRPSTPIDSHMVRIVPFTGDPEMAIGVPFGDSGMSKPQPPTGTPQPAATSAAAPPIRGQHIRLQP
jgi:hypothetical protein